MKYIWEENEVKLNTESDSWDRVNNIFIELTSRCNMQCKFCPYPVLKRKKQDMPEEYVEKILQEISSNKKDVTFHVLGEPLLNKNFFRYAALCDEYGIKYWLVTNGMLLTEAMCDKIFLLGNLQNLELSFHTFHDKSWYLRKCSMSFASYIERIKHIIFSKKRYERNIPLNLDIMYDSHLGGSGIGWGNFSVAKWQKFIDEVKVWQSELGRSFPDAAERHPKFFTGRKKAFMTQGNWLYRSLDAIPKGLFADLPPETMWLRWEIFPNIFVTLKKFFYFTKNQAYLEHTLPEGTEFEVKPAFDFQCGWANNLAILSNGEITSCCLDYEGELSLGNIANISLKEAAASQKNALLQATPDRFALCRNCRGRLSVGKGQPGCQVMCKEN